MLKLSQINKKSRNYKSFVQSAESYNLKPITKQNELELDLAFTHFVKQRTSNYNSKLITGLIN